MPYKIVSYNKEGEWHAGRQKRKRTYMTKEDFEKYSPETMARWERNGENPRAFRLGEDGTWIELK